MKTLETHTEMKISRLEAIQKRLLSNSDQNITLSEKFREMLEYNISFLKHNYYDLFEKINKFTIKNKKVICLENGEANLLDLSYGYLLYGESPIDECKDQVEKWIKGNNSFIKAQRTFQRDPYGQLHFYTMVEIRKTIDDFCNTKKKENNLLKAHEIPTEIPFLIINGGGLGYILPELCSRTEAKQILYIEPDIEMFLCSLGVINWADLLQFFKTNNQKIDFIIGYEPEESYNYIQNVFNERYGFLQAFQLIFTHYENTETKKLNQLLYESINLGFSAVGMFDDSLFGLSNSLINCKNHKYLKKTIPEKLRDIPIFIVANGPSLDSDIKYLKNNQEKALIVACGTTISTLDKVGIKPDFYVAVERIDDVAKSLNNVDDVSLFNKVINISPDIVHPLTFQRFKKNYNVSKAIEGINALTTNQENLANLFKQTLTCTNVGPLVANCAITIFLTLGFKTMYMFGVDNGSINPENHHSSYSSYYTNPKGYNPLNTMTIATKGNFVETVHTNSLFLQCIRNIEFAIQNNDKCTVFNCSNGAFINGTISAHSKDIMITHNIDKNEFINYLEKNGTIQIELSDNEINQIIDIQNFNMTVNKIINLWASTTDFKCRMEVIDKMIESIDLLYASCNKTTTTVLKGSLTTFFRLIVDGLYTFKDPIMSTEIAKNCADKIIQFLNYTKDIYPYTKYYIQGEHFKYLPKIVYKNWTEDREDLQINQLDNQKL